MTDCLPQPRHQASAEPGAWRYVGPLRGPGTNAKRTRIENLNAEAISDQKSGIAEMRGDFRGEPIVVGTMAKDGRETTWNHPGTATS